MVRRDELSRLSGMAPDQQAGSESATRGGIQDDGDPAPSPEGAGGIASFGEADDQKTKGEIMSELHANAVCWCCGASGSAVDECGCALEECDTVANSCTVCCPCNDEDELDDD